MNALALKSWEYWVLTALGVAAVVLVVVNVGQVEKNRALKRVVAERQALINRGLQLDRHKSVILRTLAESAMEHDDPALLDVMREQGVNVNLRPGAAGVED
jgi:hypothetical protein